MPRLTITVPDQVAQPYRFSLERQIVHFGRGEDNDITIDSGSISSEHAVMERIIGGYVLNDLGSTNGIKLNGEKVNKISLRNNQDIKLGDVVFGFELSEEELTALRLEDPTSQLPPLDEPPTKQASSTPTEPEIELKAEPKKKTAPAEKKTEGIQKIDADPEPQPRPEPEPEPERQSKVKVQTPAPQQTVVSQAPSKDDSRFNSLITVLAIVAFLAGIAMHFQSATGQSIINSFMQKLGSEEVEE